MIEELSREESALLRAVAYWLRKEMLSRLADVSPKPGLLYDMAQSNYEISCCALERVGLLASEGDYWRVLEPDNDRPTLDNTFKRIDLDHLLDGLACHSRYVKDLHQHYQAIVPTELALHEVCIAMTECGYMEAVSGRAFEWTDKFGPWLVRHGAWDLNEFASASQRKVNDAIATIPEKKREWLSGSLCRHKPDFVRCFFAQWIDGKWEESEWRSAPSDDWDLSLAAGLYAQLHSQ
ncbi:MAG: hypothetical protein AAFU41_01035 [Pseudomonadota bacterium]